MNKIYLHYMAALAALVMLCLYLVPSIRSANTNQDTIETVHVYGYPQDGQIVNPISGYVAVYYALQKLGYMPGTIKEYIENSKEKIIEQRREKGRPLFNGNWLHADEVGYLLDIDTPEKDRVRVIDDFGVVTVSEYHTIEEYKKAVEHLQQTQQHLIGSKEDVRVLVIDKTFEPGHLDVENKWITVIVNKQNGTIRYAVIDPENKIQKDDRRVIEILKHLG